MQSNRPASAGGKASTAPPSDLRLPAVDDALIRDADAFSQALESLARIYQLQDPRQTCSYGISLTECYALEAIATLGPVGVNEIAAALALDKSTASRAASSLVRKRLAARRPHPRDGRAIEVTATREGTRLVQRIRDASRSCHRELLAEFPPDVRRAAAALLQRIAATERACAVSGRSSSPRS